MCHPYILQPRACVVHVARGKTYAYAAATRAYVHSIDRNACDVLSHLALNQA